MDAGHVPWGASETLYSTKLFWLNKQLNNFSVLLSGSLPVPCEDSGSSALQTAAKMTRRNDTYLPVPGEEKTPDVEFGSPKAKGNESIVRDPPMSQPFIQASYT